MSYQNRPELFQPVPLENAERQVFRPLDSLSNFVTHDMAAMLNDIRAGEGNATKLIEMAESLAARQLLRLNFLVGRKKESEFTTDPEILVARLDVLMLQAAIVHSVKDAKGNSVGRPGPALTKLVDSIASITQRPAGLTYEDVVINNPEHDIRTFTNGYIGRSEADFYNGHRYIEEVLEVTIQQITALLEKGPEATEQEIATVLQYVVQSMDISTEYSKIITNRMPVEHFQGAARQYFSGIASRDLKGPSGAYTPRIPLVEYLVAGETLPEEDVAYQMSLLKYFPLTHQQVMVDAIQGARDGKSLLHLVQNQENPEEGLSLIGEIKDAFLRFRSVHLGAVKKHLPEVFNGDAPGTGGEINVPHFLKKRMNRDYGVSGVEGENK